MVSAGRLGRKSGAGFYDYKKGLIRDRRSARRATSPAGGCSCRCTTRTPTGPSCSAVTWNRAPCWPRTVPVCSPCRSAGADSAGGHRTPGVIPVGPRAVAAAPRRTSAGRCGARPTLHRDGRRRLRGGHARLRRPPPSARLDRRELRGRAHRAPPPGLGALGRGVGGRPARRRGLRRVDRAFFAGESMFHRATDAPRPPWCT